MRFQPFPTFRMYNPPIPTCAFSLFPFPHIQSADPYMRFQPFPISACTIRRSLHALSAFSHFPHVQSADSYLCFRFPPIFRMYCPSIPTCAFDLTLSSARTPRRFLPVLSTSPRLPHVHPADSYMRLRPRRVFRTYTPSIPTCTFGFLPLSARTAR